MILEQDINNNRNKKKIAKIIIIPILISLILLGLFKL